MPVYWQHDLIDVIQNRAHELSELNNTDNLLSGYVAPPHILSEHESVMAHARVKTALDKLSCCFCACLRTITQFYWVNTAMHVLIYLQR